MRRLNRARIHGGTLALALVTLTLLSILAAYTLRRVSPKLRMAHQTAGWQEARVSAEAGVDAAVADLLRNATGPTAGSWNGWQQNNNGVIGPALASTLDLVDGVLSLLGISLKISRPIFLDNLKISAASGVPTEVDVQLWALYPNTNQNTRWFRIRSMAACGLPQPLYTAPDSLDVPLRRFSLNQVRPQIQKDDVGKPMEVPLPMATRTIEVLVQPILPFELAIWTGGELSLGTSGPWRVDSYDSRNERKSDADGLYPGRESDKVQRNGNIASNLARPADSLYGPLLSANGARVFGTVATNGGDDPKTDTHENISGGAMLDSAKVRDDFLREMPAVKRPKVLLTLPPPILGLPYTPGLETAPAVYAVRGNLGAFRVSPMPSGTRGAIIILVDGDLSVGEGGIVIPPSVTAQIYVRGQVDFRNQNINYGNGSSGRPAQLQIYGEEAGNQPRTLKAYGPSTICAAFYGPDYDVRLEGNIDWMGAVAAHSFEMLGGGTGGFHYDEALAVIGHPISFRIARYVEDVRQ